MVLSNANPVIIALYFCTNIHWRDIFLIIIYVIIEKIFSWLYMSSLERYFLDYICHLWKYIFLIIYVILGNIFSWLYMSSLERYFLDYICHHWKDIFLIIYVIIGKIFSWLYMQVFPFMRSTNTLSRSNVYGILLAGCIYYNMVA